MENLTGLRTVYWERGILHGIRELKCLKQIVWNNMKVIVSLTDEDVDEIPMAEMIEPFTKI